MKILQVCKKFPYPLKDGESIANTYISRALQQKGCSITLLAMNTSKHYVDLQQLPEDFDHYTQIETVYIDNNISYIEAFKHLILNKSYNVERFISAAFKEKLVQLLQDQEYDVIQLETAYLCPYIPAIRANSKGLIVMRAHNVEYEIWERMSDNYSFGLRKWYFRHISKQLKRFEKAYLEDYDLLVTFTERDLQQYRKMGYHNGVHLSPIGLNLEHYSGGRRLPDQPNRRIGFIGALDWMPNQEGLFWFMQGIWPKVEASMPEVELHIAGRNTPGEVKSLGNDKVIVHGEVSDALEYMRQFPLLIVPLCSGGGMRVKILEGMALGKLVITTSLGAEGIQATNGKEIVIADDPQEFASAIQYYLNHPEDLKDIGEAARQFVETHFNNERIALDLLEIYRQEVIKHAVADVHT